jgi:hypothetical protein
MLGNGDGTFQPPLKGPTFSDTVSHFAAADFNGDHQLDLVATIPDKVGRVAVALGHGNGTFDSPVDYSVGVYPQFVTVGDFNGDGTVDLAVAWCPKTFMAIGSVSVLLGNSDGTFQSPRNFPSAADLGASAILAADLNGDGKSDLLVMNGAANDVSVLYGNGNATFKKAQNWTVGSLPSAIAVADFNGDGIPDFVTANYLGDDVTVVLGLQNSSFASGRDVVTSTFPGFVASGDFNEDGKMDLAVVDRIRGGSNIILGLGNGAFGPPSFFSAGGMPDQIAVADLNADGHLDLVTANVNASTASVLLGRGDGSFQPGVDYPVGESPVSVAIADFNGDGKLDLAIANQGAAQFGNVSVLLGNGDGTFRPASMTNVGSYYLHGVVAGDFNNDGKIDLAVASGDNFTGSAMILLGNGDGTFQTPSTSFAVGYIPSFIAAGDFNGDGKLDVVTTDGDISVLLGNGDGTLQPVIHYPAGAAPSAVVISDFDGDGILDIAVSNPASFLDTGAVTTLQGKGDGSFVSGPTFLAGPNPWALAVADLNGDHKPDLAVANSNGIGVTILLNAAP